eukprot:255775_1
MCNKQHWKRLILGFTIIFIVILMLPQNIRNHTQINQPFVCSPIHKGKININSNIHKHQDKLSLIVGSKAFTKSFGTYCETILDMEVIQKSLKIASSFWVMDNDKYENKPNFEFNEIHAPFFTNKEYKYKFNIHHYDFIYLFINKYNLNLKDTFKLIDYSNQINVTCFTIITNLISNKLNNNVPNHVD